MLRSVAELIDDTALAHTATANVTPRAIGRDLPEGLRLGHFKIEKKLGAGGMGEVYLATDTALDRPVAIKVLPEAQTSGVARERLIREARAQARIQHPNVAHIYFIGEEDGRLYFAMELLTGMTLADRAATGPLSVEDALSAIRAAALGLREAQRSGFTHRDVKPSNLMSDAHGIVKVLDFGLVAATPEAASGPVAQTSLAGTPLYMAPEQARGEAIDLRADIYALGATLFHLIAGRPPFAAESIDELVTLHATAIRPLVPKKGRPRVEAVAVDALIGRMMAPEPAKRFATYDELLREIELVSYRYTRPAGPWARTVASAIDLLIGAILAVLVALPFTRGGVNLDGIAAYVTVFACSVLSITLFGTTPGKALFELQVVAIADGSKPTLTQAFVRQLTMYGPTMLVSWATTQWRWDGIYAFGLAVVTVIVLFVSGLRVAGKRAPWDRISGTQVRYRAQRRDPAALLP
jgi:eukaryotic-like serine/threonine-protein kinase